MDSNPFAASSGVSDPFEDPNVVYADENADFVDAPTQAAAYEGDFYSSNPYEVVAKDAKKTEKESKKTKTGLASKGYGGGSGSYGGESDQKNDVFPGSMEDELARRERQLKLKEEALLKREEDLRTQAASGGPKSKNNWPFSCYPIAYHDIRADIPERHRTLMRQFYSLILWTWVCLTANWIFVCIGGWPAAAEDVLFSSFYLFLGVIGAWKFWYRSIYNGCKNGGSMRWMMFFVWFFAHTVFVLVMTFGIPGTAGSGLFFLIDNLNQNNNLGVMMGIIGTCAWGVNALGSIWMFKKAHRVFKGGYANEAKKDLAKAMIKNEIESGSI